VKIEIKRNRELEELPQKQNYLQFFSSKAINIIIYKKVKAIKGHMNICHKLTHLAVEPYKTT
jgi:hypothetical protein